MRNIHHSNIIFYTIVVLLYIFQPILGALFQFGLGIFQLIIAWIIKVDSSKYGLLTASLIKYYWLSLFLWGIIIVFSIIYSFLNRHFQLIMLVIPMIIGLYLVVITYCSSKFLKS